MCLGHGSSWMVFLYLCHSQQTMALRWLSICEFVVNNKSDFKTWDPCLQHCKQGNIMLSRPIKTLWFEVLWNHRMSWMKVDARVNVQWGAAHSDSGSLFIPIPTPAASEIIPLWKMALRRWKQPRGKFHKILSCSTIFIKKDKDYTKCIFKCIKASSSHTTDWMNTCKLNEYMTTQLWVCIFQNRCTSLAHVKT